MPLRRTIPHSLLAALLVCGGGLAAQTIPHPDHHEFEAALFAPFRAEAGEARTIKAAFLFLDAPALTLASWRLDLVDPGGRPVHSWHGETPLVEGRGSKVLAWDGRDRDGNPLAAGFYTLRLTAVPLPESEFRTLPGGDVRHRVESRLRSVPSSALELEEATLLVGSVGAPALPDFSALPVASPRPAGPAGRGSRPARAATATLPYTIYYGNMHSQTNHSDGGAAISACNGAEVPQAGTMGPAEAYEMARNQAGCDFLLASEHNHMYDGSTGTNAGADATAAKALWQSGVDAAASYRSAHPQFMALYGNEWGVISNGGHMNLLNPDGLPGWETNGSGQLIGHFYTAKSDYAAIYALMKQRGWIGQFNHPKTSGQFAIGGTDLAYDANGATVMALCEVMNTSAFSTNTTESETSRSFYTGAWNILLERGYKLAPSTDQDNHCANWGLSYPNRTAVLLPTGTTLTPQAFLDAVKARRVFATMDKTSQLVLTANGHVMGESFASSGPLTLIANWASANASRSATRVQFFEGVPGRNGTVTQLFEGSGSYTSTPAAGDHFYYAVVTQDNGDQLWSAPVWVNQGLGTGDTTAPTVAAAESGTSGTISVSATATDNVGVTRVEFYVDSALKGSVAAAPYTLGLDSRTLTNATHTLVAKAYDAAGNAGSSVPVSFTINNPVVDTIPPTVTASVTGSTGTLSLVATATDNLAVTKVEFYVDSTLKGSVAAAPYALGLDSRTLTNAAHTLVAKGYDAAGNVGTSTPVGFTVNNPVTTFNEVEPNDSLAAANTVPATATKIVGYFKSTSDNDDWYGVTLAAGRTLTVDMTGPTASSQDYDLYLYSSAGTQLAFSEGASTTEHVSTKNTSATAAKTIYIKVHRYNSYSTATPYTLTLSR